MADSNLNRVIETTLENIKKITDVTTIIGEPMKVSGGTTIIPVSKISIGFTSGGIDYISKKAADKPANFGGGTGSGFSIMPIAFLIVDETGNVKLINVENPNGTGNNDLLGTISGLVDKAPTLVEKIVKIFKKDKDGKESKDAPDAVSTATSTVLNNEDVNDMKIE